MTATQLKTMTDAQKNAFYGNLNKRFDRRWAELHALGFRYEFAEGYDLAVFIKERWGKKRCFAASLVMHASRLVWADLMEQAARAAQ